MGAFADADREVWCLVARLGAPVASADPYIHLDGPLAYAVSRELGYTDDDFEDGGPPTLFEEDIPLRRYAHDDEWVWAASAAAIATLDADAREFDGDEWDHGAAAAWFEDTDPSAPEHWSATRWRRRFDHDARHQRKSTHINTTSGPFKSYNAALPYAGAGKLTFFFEPRVGTDPERIPELLRAHLWGIGKKTSQGYGRVRSWELHEASGALQSAIHHNGRALSSLPAAWFAGVEPGVRNERRTIRPPYWHPDNQPDGLVVPPYEQAGALADGVAPVRGQTVVA